MTWGAVAIAGGAVVGGLISGQASKSAAATQAGATEQAAQLQAQQYGQTRQDLLPYMQTGQVGLGQITDPRFSRPFTMADYQQSPAYQFNLQQGTQALNKAAAARNMYYAPQTLQDITKYSQGMASNEFQNAFSNYQTDLQNQWARMLGLSQLGQTSAAKVGDIGATTAGAIGGNITSGAAATAAGQMGMANAINQAIGGGTNALLFEQMLQQNQQPMFGGVGASPY